MVNVRALFLLMLLTGVAHASTDAGPNTCEEHPGLDFREILAAPVPQRVPLNARIYVDTAQIPAGHVLEVREDGAPTEVQLVDEGPIPDLTVPEERHVMRLDGLRAGGSYLLFTTSEGQPVSELARFTAHARVDSNAPGKPVLTSVTGSLQGRCGFDSDVFVVVSAPSDDLSDPMLMDVLVRMGPLGTGETELSPQRDDVVERLPLLDNQAQHVPFPRPVQDADTLVVQVRAVDAAGFAGPWSDPLVFQERIVECFDCCIDCCIDCVTDCSQAGEAPWFATLAVLLMRRRRRGC
ncbi:MAG: hypothetical protein AB2A00_24595 [Myxococcota bacterium]